MGRWAREGRGFSASWQCKKNREWRLFWTFIETKYTSVTRTVAQHHSWTCYFSEIRLLLLWTTSASIIRVIRDSVECWNILSFCCRCSFYSNWNQSVSLASSTSSAENKAWRVVQQSDVSKLLSFVCPSRLSLDNLRDDSVGVCLYMQCSFRSPEWIFWKDQQLVDSKEI